MQWEYHAMYLDTSTGIASIRSNLDDCGREGWELVAVTPHESSVSGHMLVAIFKRPKTEAIEKPAPVVAFANG